jgi:hypothetical protein
MLTNRAPRPATASRRGERRPVLRWTFERRDNAVTTELDVTPSGTYELCVVPHWDVSRATVEPLSGPVDAFQRHAEVARQLRDIGWTRVY